MKLTVDWSVALILWSITASGSTFAQTQVEAHGCTNRGNQFVCDRSSFEKILRVARTVSVKAPGIQASSLKQVNELARALGKTVRSDSADLTFVLVRPPSEGIYYGPSDRELATIRVYYGGDRNNAGTLIWVESYYGQPDTAWPIVVNRLTEQFRGQFKR